MKKVNAEIAMLLRAIDQGFDHLAWHGPNLRSALRGVSTAQAAWRPASGRHNIWEIAVHAAYWKYIVRNQLEGGEKGGFGEDGSNWYPRENAPGKAWRKDLVMLERQHRLLRAAVAGFEPARLHRRISPKGRTAGEIILGIAFHDIYHAGQIRLLGRLQSRAKNA